MGKEYPVSVIDPEKRQALIDVGIDPKVIAKENITTDNTSSNDKLLGDEKTKETKAQTYYQNNPDKQAGIESAISAFTADKGREPTIFELFNLFPELNN